MVGLPGTGLGGLFYGLLILWVIARETWFTMLGRGRMDRWRDISRFGSLLALIMVALSLQAATIAWVLDSRAFERMLDGNTRPVDLLTPGLTIGSLVVLAGLIGLIHALRYISARNSTQIEGDVSDVIQPAQATASA